MVGEEAECALCGLGTFAAQEGAPECAPCAVGSYANRNGSAACTKCPVGTVRWGADRRTRASAGRMRSAVQVFWTEYARVVHPEWTDLSLALSPCLP